MSPPRDPAAQLDTAFDVLSNQRRRTVIDVLRTAPRGSLELDDLVEAVLSECDDDSHDAIVSSLYHVHLPKLAAAEVIEYDVDEGRVDYRADPLVERCLDVAAQHQSGGWISRSSDSR